jgi:hypothetical protein
MVTIAAPRTRTETLRRVLSISFCDTETLLQTKGFER